MRTLFLSLALALSACMPPPPVPEAPTTVPMSATESGDLIGENEEMPTTIESLEVEDVPMDETSLIPIAIEEGMIIVGNPDAPRLTLFTDYTCAYCAEVSRTYVPWILETYVEGGALSLEIAFLPTDEKGILSAKAALCAAHQKVLSTADYALYENPLSSTKELPAFAKKIGANAKELNECVQDSEVTAIIGMHSANAEALGITRVPAFALNGHTWLGVATKEGLQAEIEKGL